MNKLSLILDPAHGVNVSGKASPDGKHKEWEWSRSTIRGLQYLSLNETDLNFDLHSPFLSYIEEPGLTARVDYYNQFVVPNYEKTLMLSLHNDAAPKSICDKDGWTTKANGIAVWTSKGQDDSDPCATFIWTELKKLMPDQYFRQSKWEDNDPDYEQNFTVLSGNRILKPKYMAVLMEVLFQNNKSDVNKLLDPIWNDDFQRKLWDVLKRLMQII